MDGIEFDASDFFAHLDTKEKEVLRAGKKSVEDSLDDLDRIATNIAPIKDTGLRKSSQKETKVTANGVEGELTFSITEKTGSKRFNYAYWTHEMEYELGAQSQAAGGTDGYSVGNKYVERPLKGEADKYVNNWAKDISKEMDG